MTSELKNQNSSALRNRVALEDVSIDKIDRWVEQVNREAKGVRIKRNEMLDWMVKSLPDTLKSKQIKRISKLFYDAVVYMESELRKAKEARARGEMSPSAAVHDSQSMDGTVARREPSKKISSSISNNIFSSESAPKSDQKKSANSSNS
jgi:hypothetical protein